MIFDLLLFLFLVGFIVAFCMAMYKLLLPLGFKVIDWTIESPIFRVSAYVVCAILFFAGGIFQFYIFTKRANPDLSWFFPLSFLCSGLFVFCLLRNRPIIFIQDLKPHTVHLEFTKEEVRVLLKVLNNDWKGWKTLIAINHSPDKPLGSKDYEIIRIELSEAIQKFQTLLRKQSTPIIASFGYLEAAYLIGALDHEESKISFSKEEFILLKQLKDRIKSSAAATFGDDVLTFFHHNHD